MAKQPKWDVQVDISPSGPVISRNPQAGAAGEAMAGLGRSVARFGGILSAEARQADEETRELQRNTDASRFFLEASAEKDKALAEISGMADPAAQEQRWKDYLYGVQDLLDHLPDEKTQQYAELQVGRQMASWNAVAIGTIQQNRLKQADAVDSALLEESVRTRTLFPYVENLDKRLAAGAETAETHARKKELATRMIDTGLETDAIRLRIKAMPYGEAIRELDAMNRPRNLNEEEWGGFRNELASELRVEAARAGQEEQLALQKQKAMQDQVRIGVQSLKITPDEIIRLEKEEGLDTKFGEEMLGLLATKPAEENDDRAYDAMVDAVSDLRAGRITREEARSRLAARAGGLKKTTRERFSDEIAATAGVKDRAISDASQYARTQLVTVTDESLTLMDLMAAPEEQKNVAQERRAQQYRLLEFHDQSLRDFAKEHPEATADDLYVESRKILYRLRQQSEEQSKIMLQSWEARQILPAGAPEVYNLETGELVVPKEGRKRTAGTQGTAEPGAPKGLEAVWEGLDEETKKEAIELLARGMSAEAIVRALQQ